MKQGASWCLPMMGQNPFARKQDKETLPSLGLKRNRVELRAAASCT